MQLQIDVPSIHIRKMSADVNSFSSYYNVQEGS